MVDIIETSYDKALRKLDAAEAATDHGAIKENVLMAIAYALCDIAEELERIKLTIEES